MFVCRDKFDVSWTHIQYVCVLVSVPGLSLPLSSSVSSLPLFSPLNAAGQPPLTLSPVLSEVSSF